METKRTESNVETTNRIARLERAVKWLAVLILLTIALQVFVAAVVLLQTTKEINCGKSSTSMTQKPSRSLSRSARDVAAPKTTSQTTTQGQLVTIMEDGFSKISTKIDDIFQQMGVRGNSTMVSQNSHKRFDCNVRAVNFDHSSTS